MHDLGGASVGRGLLLQKAIRYSLSVLHPVHMFCCWEAKGPLDLIIVLRTQILIQQVTDKPILKFPFLLLLVKAVLILLATWLSANSSVCAQK